MAKKSADISQELIELITQKQSNKTQRDRIYNAFIEYASDEFKPTDPNSPTDDEKAQHFVNVMRKFGQSVLESIADKRKRKEKEAEISEARKNAKKDF